MIVQIIFSLAILNAFDYLPAYGQCLKINEFSELAEVLHKDDYWPYGKCNDYEFRLPDLRGTIDRPSSTLGSTITKNPYIRVK